MFYFRIITNICDYDDLYFNDYIREAHATRFDLTADYYDLKLASCAKCCACDAFNWTKPDERTTWVWYYSCFAMPWLGWKKVVLGWGRLRSVLGLGITLRHFDWVEWKALNINITDETAISPTLSLNRIIYLFKRI